ncbi:response regulator transcription factor [Nocardioides gansuensis]|uniref:response regulator transcription factor n=1 Tax=Nocardioides gansuensis TaxID=2138300 RepID=UPI001FE53314|nr:response regulator transcription factor [Nocardioides gansuensis]
MTRLRVVVAEDHLLVREGVVALLSAGEDLDVVAAVGDADALRRAVDSHQPDAVLTDIRMPPLQAMDGITAALEIRRRHPGTGVVVLSQHLEEDYVRALFTDGSAGLGYLLKERIGERAELADALRRTARGESVLDRRVVDTLVGSGRSRLDTLTPREREVLALMASGLTNPVIASRMHLSLSSVEKHVGAIFTKLGVGESPTQDRRVSAVLAWLDR